MSGERTYSRTVERALREMVQRAKARQILDLAGSGLWQGDLSVMRQTKRSIGLVAVVLVDTSIWIEVFRKSSGIQIESLVDFDQIVTCLPVMQEVLQGFNAEPGFLRARESMLAMPIVEKPLGQDVFLEAADLYRSGRRIGVTIRSSVDCVIAVCAIRNQLEVLHCDRDYDAIARISSLRAHDVRKSRRMPSKRPT